ncbi:TonB-dependent receptor [Hoylesella buccalis]|uniref:Membrane protein n=1 Tax=Hoylesella buccalis DNF00853 TaxID=1401074 RepID=A0A095ZMK7_9BACT|nr:TonB-dependent receptor [Hoylesella buccalis]KGF35908.1 membrane protein [Hoylesella buccalis DNF00853]
MKQVNFTLPLRMLTLLCVLVLSVSAFAQQIDVKGHVKDETGEPIIGATVRVSGQDGGVVTDIDGNFVLKANAGAMITVNYIGYEKAEVAAAADVVITLKEAGGQSLNEVVVIGYGMVKKSDLTGSVTALKPDSKNKGLVVTPQDMLAGKVAGVNITSDGGAPGSGANIRVRGGSSLNASNNPLIVIDGIAMDNNGVQGLSNPLSMVNPQDIESFNVLKDASATAIYGSRGSNGVIIITTKKGRKGMPVQVSYNGNVTVSQKNGSLELMNADEYRSFIINHYGKDSDAAKALGTSNTDWQKEIYRTAISHDHNVAVQGAVKGLPYRVSVGYTGQQGILKTTDFNRATAAVNLNPSFFQDHLTLNLNAKGMYAETQYANYAAISDAFRFDPTQSIYDNGEDAAHYGGYFQWKSKGGVTDIDPTYKTTYNSLAPGNPVAALNLHHEKAYSRSFVGSADIDYKVHGFEDLRFHATLGADISKGRQTKNVGPTALEAFYYGSYGAEEKLKRNLSLSAYGQYFKDFDVNHHFDVMAGYEWQHFWHNEKNDYTGYYQKTSTIKPGEETDHTPFFTETENYLVSFFGRSNYTLMNRYYLTATVRADGASRFKQHWAWFPSFAFAWKINDENKFRNIKWLSDLKLRLGWGMTGQQEGIGDYNYFAIYKMNTGTQSFYPLLGNGNLYTPQAYDENLKWETTTTYNIGLDWGLFNQRLTGSVDWYYRKTTDLLNSAPAAAGTNFDNRVMTNIGSLKNTGVEASVSWKAIQSNDWYWTIDYNFTYNNNTITALTGANTKPIESGNGLHTGIGKKIQAFAVGHPSSAFWAYQQAYDKDGNAIEGVVVDRNGDGSITDDDRYFYKQGAAPVTMGLASRLEYKNWDLGFSLRANIGNYVYNDVLASRSNMSQLWAPSSFLEQRPKAAVKLNWQSSEWMQSDYFIRNASFLKMDNITLGYSFANLFKSGNGRGLSGRLYGTVSNVFTVTKYEGLDPEVFSGIDYELYPRPISFIFGLNLNF